MATRSGRSEDLGTIPGIGPSMTLDLRRLGFAKVSDLAGADPEEMYRRLCRLTNSHQDRCVLYVFRCAVYYASRRRHRKDLLLWWNWKDRSLPAARNG